MKRFQKKYNYLDFALVTIYPQFFYPKILNLGLIFILWEAYKHNLSFQMGIQTLLIRVLGDLCVIVSLAVSYSLVRAGMFQANSSYTEDDVTLEDDFFKLVNQSRERKYYWKDVVACRVSDYQIFIINANTGIYRISRTGLSDDDWNDINRILREKVKLTSLFFYTNLILLGAVIGFAKLLWY
jgi:hypothetical protein